MRKFYQIGKISAQPHTTLCIQFLDRENNDKNNTFPLGKQICFTIVWGCAETLPNILKEPGYVVLHRSLRFILIKDEWTYVLDSTSVDNQGIRGICEKLLRDLWKIAEWFSKAHKSLAPSAVKLTIFYWLAFYDDDVKWMWTELMQIAVIIPMTICTKNVSRCKLGLSWTSSYGTKT